jgi:hypothetical protein
MCEQIRAAGKATVFERVSALLDELEQEFARERAQLSREAARGGDPRSEKGREVA